MSIIVPSRHTGIGAWVNSNLYTLVLYCIISLIFMQGYCTNTEYTGSLGYNSVCYITSRIRWVFKEKSEHLRKIRTDVPGYGGKKKRLGGIKGCKVFKEKSERYISECT